MEILEGYGNDKLKKDVIFASLFLIAISHLFSTSCNLKSSIANEIRLKGNPSN